MVKQSLIFDGNEKRVYSTDDPATVIFHFKDVATAFNNVKTAYFPEKGIVNNKISAYIFDYLQRNGIHTHYIATLNEREQLCRKSENIPLEVVVRKVEVYLHDILLPLLHHAVYRLWMLPCRFMVCLDTKVGAST